MVNFLPVTASQNIIITIFCQNIILSTVLSLILQDKKNFHTANQKFISPNPDLQIAPSPLLASMLVGYCQ